MGLHVKKSAIIGQSYGLIYHNGGRSAVDVSSLSILDGYGRLFSMLDALMKQPLPSSWCISYSADGGGRFIRNITNFVLEYSTTLSGEKFLFSYSPAERKVLHLPPSGA